MKVIIRKMTLLKYALVTLVIICFFYMCSDDPRMSWQMFLAQKIIAFSIGYAAVIVLKRIRFR